MHERFEQLLPFYVNGTLSPADRAWVEAFLREHPEAQASVRFDTQMRRTLASSAADVSPEVGLARTLARIRGERSAPGRERSWWQWFLGERGFSPAFAVACALIAVQAVVIGMLFNAQPDADALRYRAAQKGSAAQSALVQVEFVPSATEGEVRALIAAAGGWMVAGPGTNGEYTIRVPLERAEAATQLFKQSAAVRSVAPASSVPEPQ